MKLNRVLNTITERARIRDFRDLLKGDYTNFANYVRRLEILGFKEIAKGRFSVVYGSDEHDVVIKISTMNDQCWLSYAETVIKNRENPYFPRITGIRKMNLSGQDMYTAIIEKLYPISLSEWRNNPEYAMIQKYLKYQLEFYDMNSAPDESQYWSDEERAAYQELEDFAETDLGKTIIMVKDLFQDRCQIDMVRSNFMTRKDGSLVITDPVTGDSLGRFYEGVMEDDRQGELSLFVPPKGDRSPNISDLLKDQNFTSWFRKSKVIDTNGNPLVVYHGTMNQFDTFKKDRDSHVGTPKNTFFFSGDPDVAGTYAGAYGTFNGELNPHVSGEGGGNIIPVFLSIQKPMVVDAKGDNWNDIYINGDTYQTNDLAIMARDKGHDGLIVKNVKDNGSFRVGKNTSTIYVAFSPKQIKSALNVGSWDRSSSKMSESSTSDMIGIDNPGGSWLEEKREYVDELVQKYGKKASFYGATTAYTKNTIVLPVSAVSKLPGANNENRVPGDQQYDELLNNVEQVGWNSEYPILIGINQYGDAMILEGNTRVAVANDIGQDKIKATVRWFNGGEASDTQWTPEYVAKLARSITEDEQGFTGNPEATNTPAFKRWFNGSKVVNGDGSPMVLYHGTASDITESIGMFWGSTSKELANEYASMRQHNKEQGYEQPNADANVVPVYMSLKKVYDADADLPNSVTVSQVFQSLYNQAQTGGTAPDKENVTRMISTLQDIAHREESGPYYNRHDFWLEPHYMFGKDGAQIIKQMFEQCGFDGIKMIEQGELTYGAINPGTVKSVFNGGSWNANSGSLNEDFKPGFKNWFGDSLVVDKQGNPLVVYHGSGKEFTEFKSDFMGETGTALGRGYYFTNDLETAQMYSENDIVYKVYLSLQRPLNVYTVTISKDQLVKFIKVIDPDGYELLSNWDDVGSSGYEPVLRQVIQHLYEYNDNDVDMLHDIFNAGGYTFDEFFDVVRKTLGYDGIIEKTQKPGTMVYIVFDSSQIKSVDAATFDPESKNIMDSIDD